MSHSSSAVRVDRNLALAIILNLLLAAGETVAALLSGSLALFSDAAHNAGDVAGLVITLIARRLGRKPPSQRFTYGHRRLEIFAALFNGAFLLVVNTLIFREALQRLREPVSVNIPMMAAIGFAAMVINGLGVLLLFRESKRDLNLRSAVVHLLQDSLASGVVMAAAIFSFAGGGSWLDPVASMVIGLIVLRSAYLIMKEAVGILMEGAPEGVELAEIESELATRFPGLSLHHAHIWGLGPGETAFTGHIKAPDKSLGEVQGISEGVHIFLKERFGITHATLEFECEDCANSKLLCENNREVT